MEKMNKRLSKYALDPDNKKTYQGRAEKWSDYTEKWSDYHKKLLEKAEKSGIIKSQRFNTKSDPMVEIMGSAEKSHPKETEELRKRL